MNGQYEPQPGDVILFKNDGNALINKLKRWLMESPWSHVAIFYDHTKRGLPLLIESTGRGVMIRALLASEGRYILVLRHKDKQIALEAAKRAENIADNPDSWYDYFDIPRFVIPRLIWFKLTRRVYGFGYAHNPHFICSELVDGAYDGIIPEEFYPPLPADFLGIEALNKVWEGEI